MGQAGGGNRRGRPRDPALDQRILTAALAEYARTGRSSFTMDGVARRAGVGKAALYLRWPTKDQLLADAIQAHSQPIVVADTGSLRGDLTSLAIALLGHYLDPVGWVTLRVVIDAATDPRGFTPLHQRIVALHRDGAHRLVARAVHRGELPPDVSADLVSDALFGTLLMHVMRMTPAEREAAGPDVAQHALPIVDFVLASSFSSSSTVSTPSPVSSSSSTASTASTASPASATAPVPEN